MTTTLNIQQLNPVRYFATDDRYWFDLVEQWDTEPGTWTLEIYDLPVVPPQDQAEYDRLVAAGPQGRTDAETQRLNSLAKTITTYDRGSKRTFGGDWDDVVNLANFIHQSELPFPRTQI